MSAANTPLGPRTLRTFGGVGSPASVREVHDCAGESAADTHARGKGEGGRGCAQTFSGAGAVQVPLSASGFGQYSRSTSPNGPFGAGNQLDSFSIPGEAFCTVNV